MTTRYDLGKNLSHHHTFAAHFLSRLIDGSAVDIETEQGDCVEVKVTLSRMEFERLCAFHPDGDPDTDVDWSDYEPETGT